MLLAFETLFLDFDLITLTIIIAITIMTIDIIMTIKTTTALGATLLPKPYINKIAMIPNSKSWSLILLAIWLNKEIIPTISLISLFP
jgi:hypothetical protein